MKTTKKPTILITIRNLCDEISCEFPHLNINETYKLAIEIEKINVLNKIKTNIKDLDLPNLIVDISNAVYNLQKLK